MSNAKERRSFNDRRKFSYTAHVPERRSGEDRRQAHTNKCKVSVA